MGIGKGIQVSHEGNEVVVLNRIKQIILRSDKRENEVEHGIMKGSCMGDSLVLIWK